MNRPAALVALRGSLSCVILLAVAFAAGHAHAGTRLVGLGINVLLLGAPFTSARLLEIDEETGSFTPVGRQFNFDDAFGSNLAADSSGRLYNLFSRFASESETMGWINRLSLAGEVIERTPFEESNPRVPEVISDVAFNSEDELYAQLQDTDPAAFSLPVLAEIDPATGNVVREVGYPRRYSGLAFDADDNLYATSADVDLVQIDAMQHDETIIGGDLADYGSSLIAFDRDGTLYAAAHRLLVVDPTTGNAIPVGDTRFLPYAVIGLTVVPEPSSILMFAVVGLAFLVVAIGRRKRLART